MTTEAKIDATPKPITAKTAQELIDLVKAGQEQEAVNDSAEKALDTAKPSGTVCVCPRCRMNLYDADGKAVEEVHPEEEEVKEYVRRLLSGTPFERTYRLCGGNVSITFKSLSDSQSKRLQTSLGKLPLTDMSDVRARMYSVKMMYSLSHMSAPGPGTLSFPEEGSDSMELYKERFGDIDEWLIGSVIAAYGTFERLMTNLMREALNENFWKGAGLS